MDTVQHREQEEIRLDSVDGLLHFQDHFEDQYAVFLSAAKQNEENVSMMVQINEGKEAYRSLQKYVAHALELVEGEVTLSGEVVAAIQSSYSRFVVAYTELTASSETEEESTIGPLYAIEQKFNQISSELGKLEEVFSNLAETDSATVAGLTYSQAEVLQNRVMAARNAIEKAGANPDDQLAEYLTKESLDIERSLEHVTKSLEDLRPDLVAKYEKQSSESLQSAFPERDMGQNPILRKELLEDEEVADIISQHFPSRAAFESALWRVVRRIEEPSRLDTFLRVRHGSLFKEVFRGMRIEEVEGFKEQSGEQIRNALLQMQAEDNVTYDYRTYVDWMSWYDEMVEIMEPHPEMLFEDFFVLTELAKLEAVRIAKEQL